MKLLIGKTGRVLTAVACRANDKLEAGKLLSPFEAAMMKAVEKAVEKEAKAKLAFEKMVATDFYPAQMEA